MDKDKSPSNCLCCEVIIPEYEAAIRRQLRKIQELKLIIEEQRDRLSSHNSTASVPSNGQCDTR